MDLSVDDRSPSCSPTGLPGGSGTVDRLPFNYCLCNSTTGEDRFLPLNRHRARSPAIPFFVNNPAPISSELPELAERVQQLHRRIVFQLVALEFAAVKVMQVGRQRHAFSTSRTIFLPYRAIAAPISIRTLPLSSVCSFPVGFIERAVALTWHHALQKARNKEMIDTIQE